MTARSLRLLLPALLALVLGLAAVGSPSSSAPPSGPELGRTFVVSQVSGTVLVKPAGSARFSRLTGRRTIPVGSTVNASKGRVRLIGAVRRSGGTQSGVFYGGAFRATQARRDRAVIDLRLAGGSFSGCGSGTAQAAARRRVRRLWGIAKGRFRTRGKHSSATVRGTKWLTEDKCNSTLVATHQGEVTLSDGASEGVSLDEGLVREKVCARGPQSRTDKGLPVVRLPIPGWAGLYCAEVQYHLPGQRCKPAGGGYEACPSRDVLFGLVLTLQGPDRPRNADVCVRRAGTSEERCTTYDFINSDCDGCLQFAGKSCPPDSGPGEYVFRWRVSGVDLPFPLTAQPSAYDFVETEPCVPSPIP